VLVLSRPTLSYKLKKKPTSNLSTGPVEVPIPAEGKNDPKGIGGTDTASVNHRLSSWNLKRKTSGDGSGSPLWMFGRCHPPRRKSVRQVNTIRSQLLYLNLLKFKDIRHMLRQDYAYVGRLEDSAAAQLLSCIFVRSIGDSLTEIVGFL
jgi:hypothetical protein